MENTVTITLSRHDELRDKEKKYAELLSTREKTISLRLHFTDNTSYVSNEINSFKFFANTDADIDVITDYLKQLETIIKEHIDYRMLDEIQLVEIRKDHDRIASELSEANRKISNIPKWVRKIFGA